MKEPEGGVIVVIVCGSCEIIITNYHKLPQKKKKKMLVISACFLMEALNDWILFETLIISSLACRKIRRIFF